MLIVKRKKKKDIKYFYCDDNNVYTMIRDTITYVPYQYNNVMLNYATFFKSKMKI